MPEIHRQKPPDEQNGPKFQKRSKIQQRRIKQCTCLNNADGYDVEFRNAKGTIQ